MKKEELQDTVDRAEKEDRAKSDVVYIMDTLRQSLMQIANYKFSDLNRTGAIEMRAIARAAIQKCGERIYAPPKETIPDGPIPMRSM